MRQAINAFEPKTTRAWNKNLVLELLVLAAVLWLAHYFYFRSLGLYEDDYSHTSPPLGWHLSDLLQYVRVLVTWPLGRPLGFFLGSFLAFLGGKLGGLSTIYFIGYLVQITNALLFYFLLRRLGQQRIAWIGALAFAFFPADTTHIFLMHALGLHTSLTFLLVASHCYLSGQKSLAHLFSLGALLTYESPYMVFLAIPLLCRPWDRKLAGEMLRHIAVWLVIMLAVVAIRTAIGEGRIEDLGSSPANLVTTVSHILAALAIGPAVSMSVFWSGPQWTLPHWNRELTYVFLGCLPVLAWTLIRAAARADKEDTGRPLLPRSKLVDQQKPLDFAGPRAQSIRIPLTALIMLSLAYGLSFTHFPPTVTYGRLTSVHLAAAFGGALLFAWISGLFLTFAQSHRFRIVGIAIVALYLSLIVAYRFSIQQNFRQAWANEQKFWASAVAQIPDMTDGTIILVINRGLPGTRFIETNSWTDPLILQQIFRFPSEWRTPPRLFVVGPEWINSVTLEGDQLEWQVPAATWKTHREVLPDSNVILLRSVYGHLERRTGSLMIQGRELHLKPPALDATPVWAKGALYPLLLPVTR